ncbi:UDP-Glycosyltransferase/glycogen phosphorylase [Violaceomyces palustris]|uniref:UDP-Glycosyltransferase/glycogen phosphorylase n=1 Tax=Violaceomyces palustris TaxID=1673888 RepID=A0ACD0NVI3_9BASI|nr:UDP-Glycosyltransferase/glycogen phosphorylase [Violaceomyces palustris]
MDRQSAAVANSSQSPAKRLRIGFIHPDLGIGGAEKLVVDAALSLQRLGHEVEIYTSHHDRNHCFEPTRDGSLKVHVMRSYLPRSIADSFHLPLAIARQMSLVFQLILSITLFNYPGTLPSFLWPALTSAQPTQPFDLYFIDQLSAGIPWLKIVTSTRVIYYCHFPDKDVGNSIAMQRAIARGQSGPSALRKLYRIPLDLFEEGTTDYADKILVNSEFTSKQFQKSFFRLNRQPRVLYPGIDHDEYTPERVSEKLRELEEDAGGDRIKAAVTQLCKSSSRPTFVSINRFEAKKNIALAVEAFASAKEQYQASSKKLRLILAGGYDKRVRDNIDTLNELKKLCEERKLKHLVLSFNRPEFQPPESAPSLREMERDYDVFFLLSSPGPLLHTLLLSESTVALLYTPTEEHFGIVPLEAMACGVPVLSTNTGGPVETVVDLALNDEGEVTNEKATGMLRHASAPIWSHSMILLLQLDPQRRITISNSAKERVKQTFSIQKMSVDLERACYETLEKGHVRSEEGLLQWGSTIGIFIVMMATFVANVYLSQKP